MCFALLSWPSALIERVLLPTKVATCVIRLQRQTTTSCRACSWKRSYRAEIPWILPRELILKGWYHGGCSSMLAMSSVSCWNLFLTHWPSLSLCPMESYMKSNRITHEVLENHTLGCCVLLSGKAVLILWGNTYLDLDQQLSWRWLKNMKLSWCFIFGQRECMAIFSDS